MVLTVESLPENALVLIEELENGLHPVATRKMVEYLVGASERKKLQVIFTTHSNDALAILPDQAIWAATNNAVFQGKLDVESLRAITGQIERQLAIFVEDAFAKGWIEAVLRSASDSNLMRQVEVHALEGDGAAAGLEPMPLTLRLDERGRGGERERGPSRGRERRRGKTRHV